MSRLEILDKWMKLSNNQNFDIFVHFNNLLRSLETSGIIWLSYSDTKVKIVTNSEEIPETILSSISDCKDIDVLAKEEIITCFGRKFYLLSRFEINGTKNYLVSINKLDKEIQIVISLAANFLQGLSKLTFLENSAKMLYSHPMKIGNQKNSDLPQDFIDSIIPAVSYSVVNEELGPYFISTWPREFNSVINTLFVVNIFSTLNSEHIARYSNVLNSTPTSTPEDGEAISIVFAIPNNNARGGVEIQAITAVISQNFINMSKGIIIQIKSILYTAVEAILQLNFEHRWNLHSGSDINTDATSLTEPICKGLQIQLGALFAMLIGSVDVVNYH